MIYVESIGMNKKTLGISGTRFGWSQYQKDEIINWLYLNQDEYDTFRHGLCKGVDSQMHHLIRKLFPEWQIIGHPGHYKDGRTHNNEVCSDCICDITLPSNSMFARNRDIVDGSDFMLIVPRESAWQPKGGTWNAHNYTKKVGKEMLLVFP